MTTGIESAQNKMVMIAIGGCTCLTKTPAIEHHAENCKYRLAIEAADELGGVFDFAAHLQRQREFSEKTFGPGMRTIGVCDHIRNELCEIESEPDSLEEWVDVVILALDGAWRTGATPEQIIAAIVAKQTKNEGRSWPDWRTADPNKAIEHDRSGEGGLADAVKKARGGEAPVQKQGFA